MIKFFKTIALLEGISNIVLLFFAVPMKWIFNHPEFVPSIGMTHGILFIAYIVIATYLFIKFKWKPMKFFIICMASIIPFGTFYIKNKYFKKE